MIKMCLFDWLGDNGEWIASIIGVGISCIALIQTKKQQLISNKHALFEKRLEVYTALHALVETYEKNKHFFKDLYSASEQLESRSIFLILTSSSLFFDIGSILDERPRGKYPKRLITELNLLSEKANCIQFLFDKEKFHTVTEYISTYIALLWDTFLYFNLMESAKEEALEKGCRIDTMTERKDEEKLRKTWFEKLTKLDQLCDEIISDNLVIKMADEIKIN